MKEIKGLTSLRGIAALAVVMQHFSTTAQQLCDVTIPSLVPHGYIAVDFFFVLSGYIMCYTYLDSFESQGWRKAYGPFLQKRVIRLFPLNAFVIAAFLVLGLLSIKMLGHNIFFGELRYPFDVVANLLMLQGLGIGHNINGPSWSVSVEFLAYALFPLLSAFAFSSRRWFAVAFTVLAVAVLAGVALTSPKLSLTADGPLSGSLRCLSEFTLGMACYRVSRRADAAGWLGSDRITAAALAVCLGLALLRVDLLVALSFPIIVACVGLNTGRVQQALSSPLPYMLGTISYSLYLIHHAFRPAELALVQWLHPARLSPVEALGFALVGSLSVIPFAWLTYRYIEHPSRTFLRRKVTAKPKLQVETRA